jgi:hypothetical protein
MKTLWLPGHVAVLCGCAWLLFGCSGSDPAMPKAYPVKGTVLTKEGKPHQGGSLQFRPDSKDAITVVGDIGRDGTFQLRTLKGRKKADGAPAGSYEVTITPPVGADQKAQFFAVTLPKKIQIEPKDNDLEIRADLKPR